MIELDFDTPELSDKHQAIKDEGHEAILGFLHQTTRINELTTEQFHDLLRDNWVLHLSRTKSDGEEHIQYAFATTGDLIQANADESEHYGPPLKVYRGEFGDFVFSGDYEFEVLHPEESAFSVKDD